MKLTVIFLTIFCLQSVARVHSQAKLTLRITQATYEKVFQEIEKRTPFSFLFNDGTIPREKRIDVNVKNQPLEEVLSSIFTGTDLNFKILENDMIVVMRKVQTSALERVTGTVTGQNGEPIVGASVVEKGTPNGVSTDQKGQFQLNVTSLNAVIVVSYVGYEISEISLGGRSNVSFKLIEKATTNLNEVVVMGYATQKRATVTGSVVSVTGKEILSAPVTNVSNALAGRLPGVTAFQRSGEPGNDGSTIRIRGVNTMGNNTALIVIDGVPGRSLERIDPSAIETITVLKDASAAIYGSQAANGVILVTTKRGKSGKPEVGLNANFGYNQPTRLPKMADAAEYAIMSNELNVYGGRAPKYTEEEIQKFRDGSDIWKYPNTDWFKAVLKPRSAQNYINAFVSGGADKIRYFLSLGSKYQDGYYYNSSTNYKQYDFRSNIDAKVSENVTVSFDIAGRLEDRNLPTAGAASIFSATLRSNPGLPAYWPDGTPGPDIEGGANPVVISTDATGYDQDKWNVVNSNIKLDIKIPWVKGLSFTTNASIDKTFRLRKTFQTPWYLYTWDGTSFDAQGKRLLVRAKKGFDDSRLTEYTEQNENILLNGYFTYEKAFGDHSFKGLLGAERRSLKGDNFSAFRRFFISDRVDQLFAGGDAQLTNNGGAIQDARLNYFGRFNYNYKEKYLFEVVARYDGSYIFPKNKRYGLFPGISAGWRISEEDFWKNSVSFINNAKIRASWGQTGNDRIGEFQYTTNYKVRVNGSNVPYTYIFGDNQENKLLYETNVPNPEVTWEVANQSNFGFEGYLLDDKLFVELDYFYNKRSDILWQRNGTLPGTTGIVPPQQNIAKAVNRGFEFNFNYRTQSRKFRYGVGINGGYAKNKITFWDEAPGRPDYQKSTGKPIPSVPTNVDGDLYYEAIGIFRDQSAVDKYPHFTGARPGDIIFKDVNGDNKIDGNDRVRNKRSNIPTFTGGLSLNLGYSAFDLSLLFQGAAGAVRYIATYSGDSGNFLKDFYDKRWTADNPDSEGPRTFNRSQEYWRNNNNTYFLKKTDYVRLKNLELGYTLPSRLSTRLHLSKLRVYVSGYNLLTYSPDLIDFDPESDVAAGNSYPVQKVVNGGISITF